MPEKRLSELKRNDRGRVVKISGAGGVHHRLLDMGVVKGSVVEMQRVAPLGDPIEIRVRGYSLTLRKEEAANILVEVLS